LRPEFAQQYISRGHKVHVGSIPVENDAWQRNYIAIQN